MSRERWKDHTYAVLEMELVQWLPDEETEG